MLYIFYNHETKFIDDEDSSSIGPYFELNTSSAQLLKDDNRVVTLSIADKKSEENVSTNFSSIT